MAGLKEVNRSKCFGGWQLEFTHESEETNCEMKFAVYLPPQAETQKVPVIYCLAGATSNFLSFATKSGVQLYAAKHGICIVAPDTSPRGVVIEGVTMAWNYGEGASYYIDATKDKWKKHYRMYSYVSKELPRIINENFSVLPDKQSIMGHSMGGHGALICYLKNPGRYASVSAFAPLCHASVTEGVRGKAYPGYLGEDRETWKEYDATDLLAKYVGPTAQILIDQGDADEYFIAMEDALMPELFVTAARAANIPVTVRYQQGYDHSYYFVKTFIGDHVDFHAKRLFA